MFYSLDVATNGDVNKNWGGFSQLATQISNVSALLTNAGSSIASNFISTTLTTSLAALRQQNINIYINNQQSTVYSSNHATTNAAILANAPLPTITPLFISSGLGPTTLNNTMTADIESGIKVTEQVSIQGSQVFASAQLLSNSINSIKAKYNATIQSMALNSNYFNAAVGSVSSFSSNLIDGTFS
jgi:hypothetical protein